MGMTPLALVGGTPHDTDRYSNWLEARLGDVSPLLVENPVWSDTIMNQVFGHSWLSQTYASLPLGAAIPVLTNEIMAHLAASVLDDRKADAHWFQRRIPVIRYLVAEGESLLQYFGTGCLADILHPNFGSSDMMVLRERSATTIPHWACTPLGMARTMRGGGRARPASGSGKARSLPPSTDRQKCSCSAISIAFRSSTARRWRRCRGHRRIWS